MPWTWGIAFKRIEIRWFASSTFKRWIRKQMRERASSGPAHVFRAIHLDDQPPSNVWLFSSLFLQVFDLKHVQLWFWATCSFKCWLHVNLKRMDGGLSQFHFYGDASISTCLSSTLFKTHFQGTEPCFHEYIVHQSILRGCIHETPVILRRKPIYHGRLSWQFLERCYI